MEGHKRTGNILLYVYSRVHLNGRGNLYHGIEYFEDSGLNSHNFRELSHQLNLFAINTSGIAKNILADISQVHVSKLGRLWQIEARAEIAPPIILTDSANVKRMIRCKYKVNNRAELNGVEAPVYFHGVASNVFGVLDNIDATDSDQCELYILCSGTDSSLDKLDLSGIKLITDDFVIRGSPKWNC